MSKFLTSHDMTSAAPGWNRPMFWRYFAIWWVAILVVVAITNVVVDPFGLYGTRIFPRADVNSYEQAILLFNAYQPPPNVLIIGSSRVMALDPAVVEQLTGKRCFNFWVAGAKAETYYAVLRYALEKGTPIDTVIIGVEPEAFHPKLPIQPEARFVPEIAKYFIYDPHGQASIWDRLGRILTLDQISESVSSIQRVIKKKAGKPKLIYQPDGYASQVERDAEIATGTFDAEAIIAKRVRKYPERSMHLSEFTSLSVTRRHYWSDFSEYCRMKGIKVYVFSPPAHPSLVALLESLGADKIMNEVSKYLKQTAANTGEMYKDYTRLESFGGDPSKFYDEIHPFKSNGDKLLMDLLSSDNRGGGN